jgi:hypothetical protein
MTVKVTKPALNLREKLSELEFDKVPFQKMPSGSVLQVVHETVNTNNYQTSSATMIDTGISATITPKSASSKILVLMTGAVSSTSDHNFLYGEIRRDGSKIGAQFHMSSYDASANNRRVDVWTRNYLDSPATTSAVTYSLAVKVIDGEAYELGGWVQDAGWGSPTEITLMEIAA